MTNRYLMRLIHKVILLVLMPLLGMLVINGLLMDEMSTTSVPVAAQVSISCANSAAVPDPENPDLVADCETLLGLKDTLRGTASLNWSPTLIITQWTGVSVATSRVTVLNLRNRQTDSLTGRIPRELGTLSQLLALDLSNNQLTGTIPAALGTLTKLVELRIAGNQLKGCIPYKLQQRINNDDFGAAGLSYCPPPHPHPRLQQSPQ